MAKNLTDLTARTATAGTDLIHINSGGVDYKQTKEAFLSTEAKYIEFDKNTALTDQVDALSAGVYLGKVLNSTQATTQTPANGSYYVVVYVSAANYARIELYNYQATGTTYFKHKYSGTWTNSWTVEGVQIYTQTSASNYTVSSNGSVNVARPTSVVGKNVIAMTAYTWTANSGAFSLMPYNSGDKDKDYIVGAPGTTITSLRITYFYID